MPVCKFYLQGNCRYGNRCWNEHPEEQRRGATVRGDYYVSNDSRSLWHRDAYPQSYRQDSQPQNYRQDSQPQNYRQQPPQQNYRQETHPQNNRQQQPGYGSYNRFAPLGQDTSRRSSMYYEDSQDDIDSGQQYYQGYGPGGRQYGNAPAGRINVSQYNNTNMPQQRGAAGDFSFNAANQAAQNASRYSQAPSFSFNSALNRISNENASFSQQRSQDPVSFSFKSAQNQLNTYGNTSNRVVHQPQNPSFSFTSALNQQLASETGARSGQGPVSFSFKSAQNQVNTFDRNANTVQQQPRNLFGRSVVEEKTAVDKTVPSILSKSDVLKMLSMYSSLSALSEAERKQYESEKFVGGKIPTVPPPRELC